jgi:hypothetical protein
MEAKKKPTPRMHIQLEEAQVKYLKELLRARHMSETKAYSTLIRQVIEEHRLLTQQLQVSKS